MADFATLVEDVYKITNRRDLIGETELAVKSATLQLHRQEYFFKDLFEIALIYTAADYLQAIDYRTLFPRYRALKYLRKFDPNVVISNPAPGYDTNGVGPFFSIISPDQVLDSYSKQINDVCYVAGNVIQIRSSTAFQYSLIGLYLNPETANTEDKPFNSWISDEAPYAIVWAAAATIFGILGSTQRQSFANQQSQIEFGEIRNSNIVAKGE